MDFRILGPLEVTRDGRALPLGGPRQRAVLALLLLHANEVISSDALIDRLWGGRPPATAPKALQVYVSRLRKVLGSGVLVTRAPGYLVHVERGQLDSHRFEQLVARAQAADPETASRMLHEALALWRGAPLADFAYEAFAHAEITRLDELRLAAIDERIEADLMRGLHGHLVPELESLVAEHPLRERARLQLMVALYRCGRQAEALEEYQKARRLFVEELGIEPGPELQELHRAILNQDPSLTVAPAQRPERETIGLPAAANPLIGRQAELWALRDLLLGDARLVTLTGAGGSGKTRLALEVATTLQTEFERRVHFVPLAPLRQPERLAATIMSALPIEAAEGTPLKALKRSLRVQASLVVLDNFEHLAAAAPLLVELLAHCPRLKLLVTSRGSLHLSGEREFPLDPLPLNDAIELFTERARAVRPDFAGGEAMLAAICARLDRLPLALELAAPHVRLLSPDELLARIEHRLELLQGGPRDHASRQQTLRATIQWSYELLDREEQQLFARLAVFSGGFTLEAADRVCAASLDHLESLVDKNLVRRREASGEARFWMLETIREYALERLEAAENALEGACQAYADYYLALARHWVSELDQGQLGALHALERELDNFLSAFAWSHDPDALPVPVDDGACRHLPGLTIPSLVLESTHGPLDLADLAADRLVLYIYPGTTKPGRPPLPGLYALPGGRGCTAESRAFRDHAAELSAFGAQVAGLSVQTLDDQLEFADRAQMPFPLIADPKRRLEAALGLSTFEVTGRTLYRRVTLIAEHGTIVKVFYPVFPPDRNAQEVIAWLSEFGSERPDSNYAPSA